MNICFQQSASILPRTSTLVCRTFSARVIEKGEGTEAAAETGGRGAGRAGRGADREDLATLSAKKEEIIRKQTTTRKQISI